MKSDSQAFMIFRQCPNLLQAFFPFKPEAGYQFTAPSEKEVRKSFDGLFEPQDANEPTFVIEFQMQHDPGIFVRLLMEMCIYQQQKMDRKVKGILVFPKKWGLDTFLWSKMADDWLVKVLYLDEVVERDPLLKATFGPFLEKKEAVIKASAKGWYQTIHQSEYRQTLETVFFSWLFARFKDKGKEVHMWVQSMLDTNLEEIPYFRELEERGITIGEERGKKLGITIGEERGKKLGITIGEERGITIGEERGITIGEERGKAIGQIQLLQELRGFPVDSEESLRTLSPENLHAKLDQLKSLPMGFS